jgi:uncharacterized protein (DUF58 family)
MLKPDYEELLDLRRQTNFNDLNSKSKVVSSSIGGHSSLFKGRGLDFSEFREYVPGDDIRTIDWRVTARRGKAHTKIFIEERERSVYIIVDINSYMEFGTRRTFKSVQAARIAALIAWTANSLKDKTGAILFGQHQDGVQFLTARSSRKSIWEMLKILCSKTTINKEVKIEEALQVARKRIPSGSSIFIISDFFNLSEEFEKSLGVLSLKCDVTLIKVNDPADKKLPASERIKFSNDFGVSSEVDTCDSLGSDRYQKMWAESDLTLSELVQKFRIKLKKISTTSDVCDELFSNHLISARRI